MVDALLVTPPFGDIGFPAIGVGLLAAAASREGFRCPVLYPSFDFAEEIGFDDYQAIVGALRSETLVGDWIFAEDLFGREIPDPAIYLRDVLQHFDRYGRTWSLVLAARSRASAFLDRAAARILELDAPVVGFSTTFHQTCAAVGIARRLKRSARPPLIVFGGANCEGEMGLALLRAFDCIDCVANGEGEAAFVELLRKARDGSWERDPPAGMATRHSPAWTEPRRLPMDDLPVPDYDDYFAALQRSPLRSRIPARLPFETARGCWWGEKHHCTFCGLNGNSMKFRSKTPERAFEELRALSLRYGTRNMSGVDNILDPGYLRTLMPRLAGARLGLELFYEVKANLRLDQLRTLFAAGIRKLQPGIESFSDEVLGLMRKGCTAFQNVQLLRWAAELGIQIDYNLICGFPGESDAAYAGILQLLPLLEHLEAPVGVSEVRLDRFSPFFSDPAAFGLSRLRPARGYFYVYPFSRSELIKLAYFFDFDYDEEPAGLRHLPAMEAIVLDWRAADARLAASFERESCHLTDARRCATAPEHRLGPLEASLLWSCDTARDTRALCDSPLGADRVETALRRLVADKLVHRSGRHHLSLPLFENREEARERSGLHAPAAAKASLPLAVVG